jgi:D-alanyl-D-alanine carboxypeptidase
LGLVVAVAALSVANDPADARSRRKHHYASSRSHSHATVRSHARSRSGDSYNPPYADIVIDANTGKVLHEASPDSLRHPASLTKVMTLYLLFERLESGKITLDTMMPVSEGAASQAPTKLGLKPGSTLRVEDAIKGLVTKSANDAAVVIAEALGGSVSEFSRMMTRKARALGMRNTTYVNPNGLPDDDQISTARDQALLGIAIQDRFPKFYRYFSVASFVFHGNAMRNHNHLLGQVEGVDGIKTGYTRDSGFNLLTSVRRGPRHIVAAVLGGRSASSRDARMRELIAAHIDEASTKPSAGPVLASAAKSAPVPAAAPAASSQQPSTPVEAPLTFAPPPVPEPPATTTAIAEEPAALPTDLNAPIKPLKVKTLIVKLVPSRNAPATLPVPTAAPTRIAALTETTHEPAAPAVAPAPVETKPATPPPHANVLGKLPAMIAAAKEVAKNAAIHTAKAEEAPVAVSSLARHPPRGGWAIQIGAYEDEGEAKQKLSTAKGKMASMLERAEGYIERTIKGAKTYYRARFAGFDRDQAENACKQLKRSEIACMALKI